LNGFFISNFKTFESRPAQANLKVII